MALTLYGREYCGLCTTMREQLAQLAPTRGFSVQWVDIDDDEVLEARHGEWVPVLADADGTEICHYHLDLAALDDRLAKFR
ncbi:glutaredoxin family protein [Chitiniphilus purpureus]|uniref:Glutaredoxin family protein n=1 Tax=Chitiniphilus purpureus TaxID=2981137 RepID=A0ABY6DSG5_9NEIS|nr:glutaredoxin family protein [Chitiniphilus sp. CD1]UXY17314.1 glutaredoxin family protein [Chitiniphilus sp. CD1]